MKITALEIPDVLLLEPKVYTDTRGYFYETYHQPTLDAAVGSPIHFVQDNESYSKQHVLRGMHDQREHAQGKLIRLVSGCIFDVILDIRPHSPTFGRYITLTLDAANRQLVWIPAGFSHGFLTLSESATFLYKVTDFWYPQHERCIRWDDPDLAIPWSKQLPSHTQPILSAKDQNGMTWREVCKDLSKELCKET